MFYSFYGKGVKNKTIFLNCIIMWSMFLFFDSPFIDFTKSTSNSIIVISLHSPPSTPCQFKKMWQELRCWLKYTECVIKASIEIIRGDSILINFLDFCAYIQCGHWRFIVSESTFSVIIRIEQKLWSIDFFSSLGLWEVSNRNYIWG